MEKFIYKPNVLLQIAFEALNAQDEYSRFVSEHKDKDGFLILRNNEDIASYFVQGERNACTWDTLTNSCLLVNADLKTVIATAKAMNRYERKEHWKICAKLPTGFSLSCSDFGEDRTMRFFSMPSLEAQYFQSTGRRKPWAEKLPWD